MSDTVSLLKAMSGPEATWFVVEIGGCSNFLRLTFASVDIWPPREDDDLYMGMVMFIGSSH